MLAGDTNRTRLAYVREVTPGLTPASPAWQAVRVTSDTLKASVKMSAPSEIRSDRQTASIAPVAVDVGGGFNFQLSPRTFEDMIEAAVFGTWQKTPEITNSAADTEITDAGTVANTYALAAGGAAFKTGHLCRASAFTNAANNQLFRVTSSTGTTVVGTALGLVAEAAPPAGAKLKVVGLRAAANGSVSASTAGGNKIVVATTDPGVAGLGLVAGMWFRAAGFTGTAANNGWYRVQSITGSGPWNINVDRAPAGFATDAAAGQIVDLFFCDYLRNGTVKNFYSFERTYADVVQYAYFKGCLLDMALSVQAEKEIEGSFTVMGMDGPAPSAVRFAGSTDKAATTTDVLTASAAIGIIYENGVQVAQASNFVYSLALQISNNARRKPVVGSLVSQELGIGAEDITGTLGAYFVDATRLAALRSGTPGSFSTVIADPLTGEGFVVDIPNFKYTDGDAPVPGENQDVSQSLPFQALMDATLGYSIQIQRVLQ
jgi:hypothetical protein